MDLLIRRARLGERLVGFAVESGVETTPATTRVFEEDGREEVVTFAPPG